ncbi:MAG TPA: trehalose-phosphatase [Methanobacterium sp.]
MPKYLFNHLKDLYVFKNDKTSILTDIDGTISEIANIPDEALVTPSMQKVLSRLNNKFKMVGVISGRSAKKAKAMVGVDGVVYIGNHGMEYIIGNEIFIDDEALKYLENIKRSLEKLKNGELSKINGLIFEDKGVCIAIHYRECELHENTRKKILNAINDSVDASKLKLTEGRKVVEIKPPISRDKGFIVEKILEKYDTDRVIYLGDDVTDYDAFIKLKELEKKGKIRMASIIVLSKEIPDYVKNSSLFYVRSVDEVQRFFKWLLE